MLSGVLGDKIQEEWRAAGLEVGLGRVCPRWGE